MPYAQSQASLTEEITFNTEMILLYCFGWDVKPYSFTHSPTC